MVHDFMFYVQECILITLVHILPVDDIIGHDPAIPLLDMDFHTGLSMQKVSVS